MLKIVKYSSEIKVIGVVSDTHVPTRARFIPPKLYRLFEGVQLILHAGDIVDEKVLSELRLVAPVEAVAGNMDPVHLHNSLGRFKLVRIGKLTIGLMHGDTVGRRAGFAQAIELFKPECLAAIVFGHLHQPVSKYHGGVLCFNPGSAVDPRQMARPSCGRLLIDSAQISGEILYL
ncbi:MAG TPA: metallophosphoesterase family protein [Candidatus Limnocylindrales bacterium]|nr:metallophosphoesterase family protein [Candidatus Limnocylindrales bacterium]